MAGRSAEPIWDQQRTILAASVTVSRSFVDVTSMMGSHPGTSPIQDFSLAQNQSALFTYMIKTSWTGEEIIRGGVEDLPTIPICSKKV
jgi:hypothetical protein